MALTIDDVTNARKELEAALKEVAKKTGIDFTVGRIKYDATGLRCTVEGVQRGAAGTSKTEVANPHLIELLKMKSILAFSLPKDFDHTKTYKNARLGLVKVVGYNRRAHAYPFIVQSLKDSKKYKFAAVSVRGMLEA